ncbi:histidine phosphatase family protein [Ectopseudomonas mendocina]|uniref:Histidine phosphatase family protein n=1 Tax=Ectopseudomonas mendocina TaxID=300 RepID=A0ABZ2RLC1_ECTME
MTLLIELIRHGESELAGSFRGSTDDPLTEKGWSQLREAVAGEQRWNHIVSSPLQRCSRFAQELALTLGCELTLRDDLQELHFGAWEGRSSADLYKTDAAALSQFWDDPYAFTPPEAESLMDFEHRVLGALQQLYLQHKGERLLLVTHGGVIRLLVARARGLPRKGLLQVNVGFAQRFRLSLDDQGVLKELI